MHKMSLWCLFVVVGIGASMVGTSAASKPRHDVFIVGGCRTTFGPPQPDPAGLRFVVDGTCDITRFGPATVHIDEVATFAPDGTSDATASITYTFADGAVLAASSTVHGGAPNAQGVFVFTGQQSFQGGTGEFANATGSARWLMGMVDLATFEGAFAFAGDLAF